MSWNITLWVLTKRATTVRSAWLREEGETTFSTENFGERFARRKLWDNNLSNKREKNNLVLRSNLEGIMNRGGVADDME